MAQHDYDLVNASGSSFRTDINNVLDAIVTNNSGATAPTTMFKYQWWIDETANKLRIRNSTNSTWFEVGDTDAIYLGNTRSVFGRSGVVAAVANDYKLSEIGPATWGDGLLLTSASTDVVDVELSTNGLSGMQFLTNKLSNKVNVGSGMELQASGIKTNWNLMTGNSGFDRAADLINVRDAGAVAQVKGTINEVTDHLRDFWALRIESSNTTLVLDDRGTMIVSDKGTAHTITIPNFAATTFSVGNVVNFLQAGAGQLQIVAGTSVTVNTPSDRNPNARAQGASLTIIKRLTDTWDLIGDLEVV